jgi:receptor protein-tyrosine kinase
MFTLGLGMSRTPMYASTATLLVSIPASATLDDYNANLLAKDLTTTYQTLVGTDPVLRAAAAAVSPSATVNQLRESTTVTASTGALFMITVVDPDPARAATMVNAITVELTRFVQSLSTGETDETTGTLTTVVRGTEAENPYAPRLPAYLALGVIGGILLSSVGIMLFERLDTRVRISTNLETFAGLSALGHIPSLRKRMTGPESIFLDDPDAAAASESLRSVRNSIVSKNHEAGTILVVASPRDGEGKTLIAANLGEAIARTGKLVVIVDGNLRKPGLHTIFALDNARGLGTLLANPEIPWTTATIRVTPNLAVLPAGTTPAHPSDLLASDTFGTLVDELVTVADVVIVDTPSLDVANDAIAVARHAQRVVLVCRLGKTPITDIDDTRTKFEETGASVAGIVVNGGARFRPGSMFRRLANTRRTKNAQRPANHPIGDTSVRPFGASAVNAG